MNNFFIRKLISIVFALIVAGVGFFFSMQGDKQDSKLLIQGQVDLFTKGQVVEKYREMLVDKPSAEALKSDYEKSVSEEIDLFFKNYGLTESYKTQHKDELTQDFKKLLSSLKYNFTKVEKSGNTQSVLVNVEPCTIFKKLNKEYETIVAEMKKEMDGGKLANYNESMLDEEFTKRFMPKFKEQLQNLEYEPVKTVTVRVTEDGNNVLNTNSDDYGALINALLPYE